MKICQVEGATGSIDTNYEGKAQAAIDALLKDGCDFAYIHVEAPDEMGHQGELDHKIMAIEDLDRRIIAPIKKAMEEAGEDFRMLVLPDHPNPLRYRTHTGDPVPYVLYDSITQRKAVAHYTEKEAAATGNFVPMGHMLLDQLLEK
jgi:2,3-bisphosphoglycerate-independent phosphoglycerate mutase